MVSDINFGGSQEELAVACAVCGPDAASELPEIESWVRFREYGSYLVRVQGEGTQNYLEPKVLFVDSSFFEVFPHPVLYGDARTALRDPNTAALSRSAAIKYFNDPARAVGKTMVFDNGNERQVTAVYENLPQNTHFKADFLLSMNGIREVVEANPMWISMNFQTYLLLREGVDMHAFREKFIALSRSKMEIVSSQLLGVTLEEFEATGQYARYDLQPLTDIHLYSDMRAELEPNGNIQYVWIFGSIALFILSIACINFMNLATARSAHRAREIVMRKYWAACASHLYPIPW